MKNVIRNLLATIAILTSATAFAESKEVYVKLWSSVGGRDYCHNCVAVISEMNLNKPVNALDYSEVFTGQEDTAILAVTENKDVQLRLNNEVIETIGKITEGMEYVSSGPAKMVLNDNLNLILVRVEKKFETYNRCRGGIWSNRGLDLVTYDKLVIKKDGLALPSLSLIKAKNIYNFSSDVPAFCN